MLRVLNEVVRLSKIHTDSCSCHSYYLTKSDLSDTLELFKHDAIIFVPRLDEAKTGRRARAGFLPLARLLGVRPLRLLESLFLALSLFVVVFALFAGLACVTLELNFVLSSLKHDAKTVNT
jgi:hypothetical protein